MKKHISIYIVILLCGAAIVTSHHHSKAEKCFDECKDYCEDKQAWNVRQCMSLCPCGRIYGTSNSQDWAKHRSKQLKESRNSKNTTKTMNSRANILQSQDEESDEISEAPYNYKQSKMQRKLAEKMQKYEEKIFKAKNSLDPKKRAKVPKYEAKMKYKEAKMRNKMGLYDRNRESIDDGLTYEERTAKERETRQNEYMLKAEYEKAKRASKIEKYKASYDPKKRSKLKEIEAKYKYKDLKHANKADYGRRMTEYQREGLSSAEKYKRENEVKQSEMRAKMEYKQIKSERKMMEDDYYYEYRRGRGNGETEASTASAEETTETTAPATATTTTTTSTSTSANTVDSLGVIHFGDEDEEEEEEELMTEEEEEEEGVPSENEELVEYASESYQNDNTTPKPEVTYLEKLTELQAKKEYKQAKRDYKNGYWARQLNYLKLKTDPETISVLEDKERRKVKEAKNKYYDIKKERESREELIQEWELSINNELRNIIYIIYFI